MAEDKVERKVTVILATDVVGYSSKIEQNETQTLQTLKACREIIEGLIGEHQGRVFNTAGDSVLAEFPSAVEAVLCASEFQRTIKERNDSVDTEAEQMEFRAGINMGDVVIEGDNLYGEGVNVAARLEALAQPGGICLSKNVHDIVYNKMNLSFTDLGEQQVKDTVVHAVDVSLDGTGQRKLPGTKKAQSSTRMAYLVAGLAIVALIVGGGVWWSQKGPEIEQPEEEKKVARDNLPIILVKPFKNLGSEDTSVSNAITESLISSLSRYKGISVLTSSTSFHILETNMPDNEIAEKFGVKHAIQGSVQSFGKNTRLTVELNDLSRSKVVWSDKVDFLLDDIFQVQDEIGNKILGQLQITAVGGQHEKQFMKEFETFDQYLLFLNFHKEWGKYSKEGYENTLEILEEFRSISTNQNELDSMEAWNIHLGLMLGLSKEKDEDIKKLDDLTNSVLENRGNETDYGLRAIVELDHLSKDCSIATQNIVKALDIGTNADIFTQAGWIYHACGDHNNAIKFLKEAFRLKPIDGTYLITSILVANWHILGKTEEIKNFLGDKINNKDIWGPLLWIYASMELQNGNTKKAKEYFERAIERGARKFMIMQMLRNEEAAEKLTKSLESLGPLD
jgi:class 3 adenylate cyclase/TolB-like protein